MTNRTSSTRNHGKGREEAIAMKIRDITQKLRYVDLEQEISVVMKPDFERPKYLSYRKIAGDWHLVVEEISTRTGQVKVWNLAHASLSMRAAAIDKFDDLRVAAVRAACFRDVRAAG